MALLDTIKSFFEINDPLQKKLKQLLNKKEKFMLDKLASLFPENSINNVAKVLNSVANFVQFIQENVENDQDKVNEIIDHIKVIFDSHKK